MTDKVKHVNEHTQHAEEHILVVPREKLCGQQGWHGLYVPERDDFVHDVLQYKEFQPRSEMEADPRYKQIIPYLVFHHGGKLFLMQRTAKASEKRLAHKYSIGIGGHIRKSDMTSDSIIDWAYREFHEEVAYQGSISPTFLGILNDDTNEVGRVHAAFVYLLHGDSPDIRIASELQSGTLVSLPGCLAYYQYLESWSQIVLDTLRQHTYISE